MMNNTGAAASAKRRAQENLDHALRIAIEPVCCPTCGIYQPDMVQVLRQRHRKGFDPNKYAAARIKYPAPGLWRAACEINTKEAYTNFMAVWPSLDAQAKKQIKELRYPPHVRKLVSSIGWMLWGALALCAIGAVLASIIASRY
jgi:hypothetical protein